MDAFAKQGLALHVLPRLLDNQVRQLQDEENSGLRSGIRKPCKDHANCIARLPSWLQCESSSTGRRLVLDCNTISEGDLLLSEDFAQGFLVAFDMLACYSTWQRSGRLQIHTATVLREFLQPRWWMEDK
ncbi:unnamed protein product, partial [Symbiodinium necroappetens]